jgi:hypothetical protein
MQKYEQVAEKTKKIGLFPPFKWALALFYRFDQKMDGAASFFLRHWGKSRFMVAMSKKAQYLGLENLFLKGPKAFMYFFLFYLIRDTILYIILPIYFATLVE